LVRVKAVASQGPPLIVARLRMFRPPVKRARMLAVTLSAPARILAKRDTNVQ